MLRLPGDRWIGWEFKLADLWIGAFWDRKRAEYHTLRGRVIEDLHVWVCLIPCFPIHYIVASRYASRCPHCEHGVARRYGRCDYCGEMVP